MSPERKSQLKKGNSLLFICMKSEKTILQLHFHELYRPWGCKESDTTNQLSPQF